MKKCKSRTRVLARVRQAALNRYIQRWQRAANNAVAAVIAFNRARWVRGLLVKPLDPAELQARITRYAERYPLEAQRLQRIVEKHKPAREVTDGNV